MGKIENDKMRKLKNEHFIKAFEYVSQCLNMTQGALAVAVGSKSSYISNYRNGTRPVTEEVIENLIRISSTKPGLQIFSEYLYGFSDIMLLVNVSDEEMADAKMRHDNPDYDKVRERREKLEKVIEHQTQPYAIDPSSQENATIAAYIEAIESLKRELHTKNDLIQSLREQITTQNQLIAEQKARLIDYRRIIDEHNGIESFHFPIGAAEDNTNKQARK